MTGKRLSAAKVLKRLDLPVIVMPGLVPGIPLS
jgi:hypothetical protein